MKKNYLIVTGLIDEWEFGEKNFLLGRWCEFYEFNDFDKDNFDNKLLNKNNIIKSPNHWEDIKKKNKDYKYIEEKLDFLLEIISEKLNKIHNINEKKEYWRIIIFTWLCNYITTMFDRWENIRIFFENNKSEKFYSNIISLDYLKYIPKNHTSFVRNVQKDEWNHMIYLRLLLFLKIENLLMLKKKIKINNFKKKIKEKNFSFLNLFTKFVDSMISKVAFKQNKIILESFYFPKSEFLKICLKCKLIPSKYSNFFSFDVESKLPQDINKRTELKDFFSETKHEDKFIQFILINLYKDIPKSYLENFELIKNKIYPLSIKKKTIFSMHSLTFIDNFKVYIAESKKSGSKYIHTIHGGGLIPEMDPYMNFFDKISDKIIKWDNTKEKKDNSITLSPTLPIIKKKNFKKGKNCSLIFLEHTKYVLKFSYGPGLITQSLDLFDNVIELVKNLNPEIRSNIKFRTKENYSHDTEKKFQTIFGENSVSKPSNRNTFSKTILDSKLLIHTYPLTAFSESMYSNVPTILILNKNNWLLSKQSLNTLNHLIENKIAFDNFKDAKNHINKTWNQLDIWWNNESVQFARKNFLSNFFNVKSNWYKEWSNYIYSTKNI